LSDAVRRLKRQVQNGFISPRVKILLGSTAGQDITSAERKQT